MMHPLFSFMLCYFCFFISLIFTRTTCQPLVYMCSNSTYTYGTNLNSLLSNLSSAGPRENGFYNYMVEGANATTVYGLFMCQGYASSGSCATCVKNASTDILRLCPKQKTAIIWYNRCMLRYSDESIMGRAYQTTEEQVIFMSCDTRKSNHSSQPIDLLMQRWLVNTLNVTISRLTGDRAGKKFVTREAKFSMGSDVMYVLGQCTPDLSDLDCQKCLSNGIQRLTDDCYSLGARAILPSCVLRYEKYPFYNTIAAASAPPPNYSVTTRPEGNFHVGILMIAGKSRNSSSKVIIAIVVPVIGIILLIAILCFVRIRNVKKKNTTTQTTDETGVSAEECSQYDFATVQAITNDFSHQSKIGEGGYGPVYKGMLPIGQEVAVKRLSRSSGQGAQEFKNEVEVVAKLQHRNLVKLLGFCSQGEEKILIYEFVPNKSLDYFLFDKQYILEWSRRYKIIKGIARGLLYLHEDSRLRIIHRDLKASNILLDANMDPKIADFGTAKIFGVDQTQGRTNRIVGTYGYMSPEYAMHGKFSIKSDIFSFGVLVLEIITGEKNNFFQSNKAQDLLSYAWEQWRDGLPLKILDPILGEYYTRNEVMQCMHIGLLCVQEDANERPTMVEVMLMLSSYSANNWSAPREPAFYRNGSEEMPKEIELEKPATINEVSISVLCPR